MASGGAASCSVLPLRSSLGVSSSSDPLDVAFAVPMRGRGVRGRKFVPPPPPGTRVTLERESDNPVDPRGAIKCFVMTSLSHQEKMNDKLAMTVAPCSQERVITATTAGSATTADSTRSESQFLGYLPRSVSCHLSPWIDLGVLSVSGRVVNVNGAEHGEDGGREAGNCPDGTIDAVTVTLTASSTTGAEANAIGSEAENMDGMTCAWAAATAAAGEEDAAEGGSRLVELTRKRMWLAVDEVRKSSDAVLLTPDETAALDALHTLEKAPQSLAVRLLQRKIGWIRTSALVGRYPEVSDVATAAASLHSAGLVRSADKPIFRTVIPSHSGSGGVGGGGGGGAREGNQHLRGHEKDIMHSNSNGDDAEEEEGNIRDRLDMLTREELAEVAHAVRKSDKGRRFEITTEILSAPRHRVLAAWRSVLLQDGKRGGYGGGYVGDDDDDDDDGDNENLQPMMKRRRLEASVLGGALHLDPALVSAVRVVLFLTFLDFSRSNLQSLVFQEIGVVRFPKRSFMPERGDGGDVDGDDNDVWNHSISVDSGGTAPPPLPPLFSSRVALDKYTAAAEVAGEVDAALEAGDETKALQLITPVLEIFLEAHGGADTADTNAYGVKECVVDDTSIFHNNVVHVHNRFNVSWIHTQMATVGVGLLERRGRYADATRILFSLLSRPSAPDRRGGWYIRAATNFGHLGRYHAALKICEAGLSDTWVRCGDRLGMDEDAHATYYYYFLMHNVNMFSLVKKKRPHSAKAFPFILRCHRGHTIWASKACAETSEKVQALGVSGRAVEGGRGVGSTAREVARSGIEC